MGDSIDIHFYRNVDNHLHKCGLAMGSLTTICNSDESKKIKSEFIQAVAEIILI